MCPDIEAYAPLVAAAFGGLDDDDGAERRTPGTGCGSGSPTGRCARPTRCSPSSPGCSTSPTRGSPPPRCSTSPRCRRCGAGSASTTTRWSGSATGCDASGVRWGLDAEARAPYHLDGVRAEHLADRASTGSCSASRWTRTACAPSAWRCRSTTSTATTSTWPAGSPSSSTGSALAVDLAPARAAADGLGRRARRRPSTTSPRCRRSDAWQVAEARRQLAEALDAAGDRADAVRLGLSDVRALLARPAARPADPGELPHRPPDHVHDGADAVGAAPGGRACSAWTTACSRGRRTSTATTCSPAIRGSASATRARRTGSCSSTRSWPPRSAWSCSTPAPTSGPAPSGRRPCRSASCSTCWTGWCRRADGAGAPPAAAVRRAQLRRRSARGAGAVQLRPGGPLAAPRRCCEPASRARRVPAGPAARPRRAGGRARRPGRFLEHPVRGVPAAAARADHRRRGRGDRRRAPGRAQGPRGRGPSATGCCGPGWPASAASRRSAAERLRGDLPPGALGRQRRRRRWPATSSTLVDQDGRAPLPATPRRSTSTVDAAGRQPAGRHGPRRARRPVVRVEYSRLGAKHRVRAWAQLLALVAGRPGRDWRAATVGRGNDGPAIGRCLVPPTQEDAVAILTDAGRALPARAVRAAAADAEDVVPPTPSAGAAGSPTRWCRREGGHRVARRAAATAVRSASSTTAEHRRVWGDATAPATCSGSGAVAGEPFDDEPHRFGQLARQVWDPLLATRGCSDGPTARPPVDGRSTAGVRPVRRPADRHHRAGGERRHRQDAHDRRAGGPLRRRGHGAHRRADAGHVRPGGDGRAARAGARAARHDRGGARRPRGRARVRRPGPGAAGHRVGRRGRRTPAAGWRPRSPSSTPPPSRPRTGSACRCWPGSASRPTSTPT